MEHKTRCIVLRTVKYGDKKLIIDLLTREEGRATVLWKIPSSPKAKVKKQFFQPLTILDVDYDRSPRQSMAQLKDARIAYIYSTLPFVSTKLSLVFFLAEFLTMATRDSHTDTMLYDFVEQALTWLDTSERGIANFHLTFMIRMSLFLGFYPDMDSYHPLYFFDLREGTFRSHAPLHSDFLTPEDAEKMLTLMRMSPSNLHLFRMSRTERNRIVDIILHFYRLHIPAFGEMKTLSVLRENHQTAR